MFRALDQEDLQTVLMAFVEVHLKKDDILIRQGEDGDSLYVIESGEVDVLKLSVGRWTKAVAGRCPVGREGRPAPLRHGRR